MSKHFLSLLFSILLTCVYAQDKSARIDSLFHSLNTDGELSGAFLVVDSGKIISERYFGFEDADKKNKITHLSRFELASVSKQFIAMAVMQLEEKGKLSFEHEINKYFPNLKFNGVKIKNLLRNTSGISEFLAWDPSWIDKTKVNSNRDVLKIVEDQIDTLLFAPGDQYFYSNTNWVLLALIVEKVSGQSFSKYMEKNIFKPAGMNNTSVFSARSPKANLKNYAKGLAYDAKNKTFVSVDDLPSYRYVQYLDGISGPYGIASTAQDLLKWNEALYKNKLLEKKNFIRAINVDTLNNGKPVKYSGLYYGNGWLFADSTNNENKMHFHTGGYPGYHSIIVRENKKQRYFIALINKWNTLNVYSLTLAIDNILQNQQVPKIEREPFSEAIVLMEFQVKQLLGTYAYDKMPSIKLNVTADSDGNIFAETNGQSIQIYPKSEFNFFSTQIPGDLTFIKENDKITTLTILVNGEKIRYNKVQ